MRIQKREHKKRVVRYMAKGIFTAACMAVMVWCMPIVSQAEATGKVIPNSVNIRKSPDVNSEVVGSTTIGKEVTIKGKVNASGTTWYQVYVSGDSMGYIRADMLEPEAEAEIPVVTVESSGSSSDAPTDTSGGDAQPQESSSGDSGTSGGNSSSGGATVGADESIDPQYAKIKVNSRVRPEPSTKKNAVGNLTEGSQVIVSGKSAGSDGKTWYYVSYTASNGSEGTGYIREDLLELGEMVQVEEEPPQEEVPVEEPAPMPVVSNDYVVRLEQTESGPVWYLDDNIRGETQELEALLQSAYSKSQTDEESAKAVVKQRIVIVVLAVLLVVLIVTVVIMAFKLRDAYYEDYEDDEEDEEEEEERPVRRRRGEEEEEERPARRREVQEAGERRRSSEQRSGRNERSERGERRGPRDYEDDPVQGRDVRTGPKRKPKNFLLDDDEFEFEFLNMDDKDLM